MFFMESDEYEQIRTKYGSFLDKAVQRVLDEATKNVEHTINELEKVAEEYTSQTVQPVDEYEIEDYFYKKFKEYNVKNRLIPFDNNLENPVKQFSKEHIDNVSLVDSVAHRKVLEFYSIEDTVVYIFKSRLDNKPKN